MKDEILEVCKDAAIDGGKLLAGMLFSIAAGKFINKEFDKADARLNPKRKGINKILHRDNKQASKKNK